MRVTTTGWSSKYFLIVSFDQNWKRLTKDKKHKCVIDIPQWKESPEKLQLRAKKKPWIIKSKGKNSKNSWGFFNVWLSVICKNEWSCKTLDSTSREYQVCFRIAVTMLKDVKLPKQDKIIKSFLVSWIPLCYVSRLPRDTMSLVTEVLLSVSGRISLRKTRNRIYSAVNLCILVIQSNIKLIVDEAWYVLTRYERKSDFTHGWFIPRAKNLTWLDYLLISRIVKFEV